MQWRGDLRRRRGAAAGRPGRCSSVGPRPHGRPGRLSGRATISQETTMSSHATALTKENAARARENSEYVRRASASRVPVLGGGVARLAQAGWLAAVSRSASAGVSSSLAVGRIWSSCSVVRALAMGATIRGRVRSQENRIRHGFALRASALRRITPWGGERRLRHDRRENSAGPPNQIRASRWQRPLMRVDLWRSRDRASVLEDPPARTRLLSRPENAGIPTISCTAKRGDAMRATARRSAVGGTPTAAS